MNVTMTKAWIRAEEERLCWSEGVCLPVHVRMRDVLIHLYISLGNSQAIKPTYYNRAFAARSDLIGEWVIPVND